MWHLLYTIKILRATIGRTTRSHTCGKPLLRANEGEKLGVGPIVAVSRHARDASLLPKNANIIFIFVWFKIRNKKLKLLNLYVKNFSGGEGLIAVFYRFLVFNISKGNH